MKNAIITSLVIALLLSWLGFFTWLERPAEDRGGAAAELRKDVIRVWISELIGSPEEAYYYELADCWNATNPNVQMEMAVMSHAGFESKLRVAIASGQPPDVSIGGMEVFETLKHSGKSSDLAVTIPDDLIPTGYWDTMAPVVKKAAMRDGKQVVFPIYRFVYGGFLMANRTRLLESGFDDEKIRREEWTFHEFREAARKMTRDVDGDGTIDFWGFGSSLSNLEQLFEIELGPGVWGKDIARTALIGYDESSGRWTRHPDLTQDDVYQVFLLIHQLYNIDRSWNPKTLSMTIFELHDEIDVHQRLGMAFCSVPWMPKTRKEKWELEVRQGVQKPHPFPDLTAFWMPTLRAGDRPSPTAGVYGLTVLKQDPYRGDAHTGNACRAAYYLTHPIHLARAQLREFRHLPPDPVRFSKIFPELMDLEDPWVRYYNEVMASDTWHVRIADESNTPDLPAFQQVTLEKTNWLRRTGLDYIEQVIYQKITPKDAAKQFYEGLKEAADHAYENMER